ncbi:MAG: glycosyltransferase [Acidobacteria bacterium]|nr:glycosyltransferase [Acidobacteriota bacterium]MCU0253932.1 glycosyltransferase [Acidobacteriota bacterium]
MILEREAGTLVVLTGEGVDGTSQTLRRAQALAHRWPGPVAVVALDAGPDSPEATELSRRAQLIEARHVLGGALRRDGATDAPAAAAVLLRMATGGSPLARIYARLRPDEWPWLQAFADVAAGVPVDLEIGPEAGVPEIATLWGAADALIVADMDRRYPLSAGSPALPVRVVPDGDGEEAVGALAELPIFGGAERISVVVPVGRQAAQAVRLVESVVEHTAGLLEVILIDDASPAPALALLERLVMRDVRVRLLVNRTPRGLAASVNRGLAAARGDVVALVDAGVVVTPGWSARLAAHRTKPRCGAVGPLLNRAAWPPQKLEGVTYDETTLAGLARFAEALARGRAGQATPCPRLAGSCLLIPRSALRRVGGLDPRYTEAGFEDDDWCARLKASGLTAYRADDVFVHHDDGAIGEFDPAAQASTMRANWRHFQSTWGLPEGRDPREGWRAAEVCGPYDRARHFIAPWLAQDPIPRLIDRR